MLKILPIMLLSTAQKSSLLCSKLCFQCHDYASKMLLDYSILLTAVLEYLDLIFAMYVYPSCIQLLYTFLGATI